MDPDQKLSQEVSEYAALAKENPNVDVSMLMMNALQNQKQNVVSPKAKRWAYTISLGVPPLGLFLALKYYMGDEDDGKQVAWVCVILTVISVVLFWLGSKLLFSGSGTSIDSISKIKLNQIQELGQ